jgi:peptidoglycan/xylan/chitin deacetylase (PgdA/CDA1 family)
VTTAAATATAALAVAAPIAAAAAVAGLAYVSIDPASSFWGPVISRVPADRAENRIALTLDDGPTPGTTDRVLDVLRDANAVATFFVIGVNARRHPDLVRRMWGEGHLVANHSLSHSHYGSMRGRRYWRREIRECDEIIAQILGERPSYFRPPMGVKTWYTTGAAREAGHPLVTWSRRAMDGIPTTPQKILSRFEGMEPGEILLLHDGVEPHAPHADRTATIESIRPLIDRIRGRGLEPARLDELLPRSG